MEHNPYQPPLAELSSNFPTISETLPFYIVSKRKFLLLTILTFGSYFLYWFYAHWKYQQATHNENIWPVARGIFSVFFVYSLYQRITDELENRQVTYRWSYGVLAWVYIIFSIIGSILDQFDYQSDISILTLFSLLTLIPTAWSVLQAQKAANMACADPDGTQNNRLTWVNWIWIGIGSIIWVGMLINVPTIIMSPDDF